MIKPVNATTLTEVLDTVYNLGNPKEEGFPIKPEYKFVYAISENTPTSTSGG